MLRYPISSGENLVVIANVLKPLLQDSHRFYGKSKCTTALYIKAGRLCEIQQILNPWKGLYGSNLGGEGIRSMNDVEKRLLQLKEKGAEQIKVVLSGLVSFRFKERKGLNFN